MSEAFAKMLAFGILESKNDWSLDAPARTRGTEDKIMLTLRHCRDDICARVDALLAELRKR